MKFKQPLRELVHAHIFFVYGGKSTTYYKIFQVHCFALLSPRGARSFYICVHRQAERRGDWINS